MNALQLQVDPFDGDFEKRKQELELDKPPVKAPGKKHPPKPRNPTDDVISDQSNDDGLTTDLDEDEDKETTEDELLDEDEEQAYE